MDQRKCCRSAGGEILGAGLVVLTDLLVNFVVHSFLAGLMDTVFDIVAVVPLVPCSAKLWR